MKERVLLVDDEKDFLATISERMEARDLEVRTASSAQEALALVEAEPFDAIILDLMMPELDGLETLKIIKKKRPEAQIILLTGHASIEKGIEAMKLGAMDFLEKPADVDLLARKIAQAKGKKMLIFERQMEEKIKKIMNVKGW